MASFLLRQTRLRSFGTMLSSSNTLWLFYDVVLHVAGVACLECSHRQIRIDNILTAHGNKQNFIMMLITF